MGAESVARGSSRGVVAENIGQTIIMANGVIERLFEEDVVLLSLTVQTPYKGREDFLVVGRFRNGGVSMVAFHGAATFYEAIKGFLDRLINRTLVFREDQYANR
jgi:hypothetical protein